MAEPTIEDYFIEDRTFPPPADFVAAGSVATTARSTTRPTPTSRPSGPARPASSLTWFDDFDTMLEWDLPFAKWFVGGTLNVSYNCLDRHVEAGRGDRVAYHWEGEPGDTRTITYADLLDEVSAVRQRAEGRSAWQRATGSRSTCR